MTKSTHPISEFSSTASSWADADWDEAFDYRPGTVVERVGQPGQQDVIATYDPMLVPPIGLMGDPRPRYPHELRIVSYPPMCQLDQRDQQETGSRLDLVVA